MAITLSYASQDLLITGGTLQILGRTVERETLGAKHTLRLRMDFWESSFADNAAKIEALRARLLPTTGRLILGGLTATAPTANLDRTVYAGPSAEPVDAREPVAGGTRQALTFEFWWWEPDLADSATVTYAGTNLGSLGTLQILGQSVERERFGARHTLRLRLDFFLGTFKENAAQVAAVRTALKKPVGTLTVAHQSPITNPAVAPDINRFVHAGADVEPIESREPLAGQTRQGVAFEFWWWEVDIAAGDNGTPLVATLTVPDGAGGTGTDEITPLGNVEEWREGTTAEFWSLELDARRKVNGTLEARGWWSPRVTDGVGTVTESQTLAVRQADLYAYAAALQAIVQTVAVVPIEYGSFARRVHLTKLDCQVDQAQDRITWSLSGTYLLWPDAEQNWSLAEYQIRRRTLPDGSETATLTGQIAAETESLATERLAQLRAASFTADWLLITHEEEARYGNTQTMVMGGDGAWQVDGSEGGWLSLQINDEWRRKNPLGLSYQRPAAGNGSQPAVIYLGNVEQWSERYQAQGLDELRAGRRTAGGVLELRGRLTTPAEAGDEDAANGAANARRARLLALRTAILDDFNAGPEGRLRYQLGSTLPLPSGGSVVFDKTVRVRAWDVQVDEASTALVWTLQATYTHWPNEANYALVEYRIQESQDGEQGTVTRQFSGRIGAASSAHANAKLLTLQTALFGPTGTTEAPVASVWQCSARETTEVQVQSETNLTSGSAARTTEGSYFTELSFNLTYRKALASIVSYTQRTSTEDDVRSGWVRTTLSGEVTAHAATETLARDAATAKAATLGVGPGMLLGSSVSTVAVQRLADTGQMLTTVSYSYSYQSKPTGAVTYLEYTADITLDPAGPGVETVSGQITGNSLADCETRYALIKSATYSGRFLLSERVSRSQVEKKLSGTAVPMDDRLTFQLSYHVNRTTTAAAYAVTIERDYQALEARVTLAGMIQGPTATDCRLALPALRFAAGIYGSMNPDDPEFPPWPQALQTRESIRYQTPNLSVNTDGTMPGPPQSYGGGTAALLSPFFGLEFSETYALPIADYAGILSCEVNEEVQKGGTRWVERMLPDAPSVIQNAGHSMGTRTVTGQVTALTRTTCEDWADTCKRLLTGRTYATDKTPKAQPDLLSWGMAFVPMVTGIPLAETVEGEVVPDNVRAHTLRFTFREWLPYESWAG